MVAENGVIVLESSFAERIIIIEIVIKRLAKEILRQGVKLRFPYQSEDFLPDNVNDGGLRRSQDSLHHTF